MSGCTRFAVGLGIAFVMLIVWGLVASRGFEEL
jgi:hypothetical protein